MTKISESSFTGQDQDGSTLMEKLELGKKLAAELEHTDTLGRWMAHYLAELMTRLEYKTGSEREVADSEVADLILRLWSHRRKLPLSPFPLAEVEAVETAIARLAPQREPWSYFRVFSAGTQPGFQETGVSAILKSAMDIDRLAGDLVRGLICRAAVLAEERDATWIKQAEKLMEPALQTTRRLRYIDNGGDVDMGSSDYDSRVKREVEQLSSVLSELLNQIETGNSEISNEGCV